MQIKLTKSYYFSFFFKNICTIQKKVVPLHAFCRGFSLRNAIKLRFNGNYSEELRSPQELEILGDPI